MNQLSQLQELALLHRERSRLELLRASIRLAGVRTRSSYRAHQLFSDAPTVRTKPAQGTALGSG